MLNKPTENICNKEMDNEYLASKFLSGLIYPRSYVAIRTSLSGLVIPQSAELKSIYTRLQEEVSNSQLLSDSKVLSLWKGDNQPLLELLLQADELSSEAISVDQNKIAVNTLSALDVFGNHILGNGYEGLNRAAAYGVQTKYTEDLISLEIKALQTNKANINRIMKLYGSGKDEKLPKKKLEAKYSTDYTIFVNDLLYSMSDYVSDINVCMSIGNAYAAGQSLYPKDDLDPYVIDEYNNYLDLITNPKEFYQMCRKDEIMSQQVGQAFSQGMPGFSQYFSEFYIEDYDKLSYQEKISFNKEFGLGDVDPSLTSFCSSVYVNYYIQSNQDPSMQGGQ